MLHFFFVLAFQSVTKGFNPSVAEDFKKITFAWTQTLTQTQTWNKQMWITQIFTLHEIDSTNTRTMIVVVITHTPKPARNIITPLLPTFLYKKIHF